MGKATFTVVTGNPLVHFITLHIVSAPRRINPFPWIPKCDFLLVMT